MIAFVTLFLGLVYGVGTVELSAGPEVARIELYVDGALVTEVGPPWRARLDFGAEIAPRELVAVAKDASGARLGEARQWVNRATNSAEARFILARDRSGRAKAARLVWRCPASPDPKAVAVSFDGEPIEAKDPERIPIPPYAPGVSHVLLADVRFGGGLIATAVASVGGATKGDALREMTAFPIRVAAGRKKLPALAKLEGWFEAGGRALPVAAVEEGPAEVVFVPAGLAREELKRLSAADSGPFPWKRRKPIELPSNTRYRFASTMPRVVAAPPSETIVFPVSEDYTPLDGPFLRLAVDAPLENGPTLPRVAEAVATSGLSATARERRRAVVLLLGRGALESSVFDAPRARRYLARIRVPLHVWRLAPEGTEVAPGWPDATDASTIEGLRRAFDALRADLASQRVVWLEGRVNPSAIDVGARAVGVVTAR